MNSAKVPFELVSLAQAENYQRWMVRTVEPFLGRRVLELGSGIGNMSRWLPIRERLVLSEVDPALIPRLRASLPVDPRISCIRLDLVNDELDELEAENFDTVVSFNVLEHLQDDRGALERVAGLLKRSQGPRPRRLVSLIPAHGWAFGGIDRTFGHFRRYSRRGFIELLQSVEPGFRIVAARYFNTFGLLGWVVQGRLLGKTQIGEGSIRAFERLCPWIAPVDDWLHRRTRFPAGQSLIVVAEVAP